VNAPSISDQFVFNGKEDITPTYSKNNHRFADDNNNFNVNQTFIQRTLNNIFKSDAKIIGQRNSRTMLRLWKISGASVFFKEDNHHVLKG